MGSIGRNEPCHCGSGKKYKNCHQQLEEQKKGGKSSRIIKGLVAVGLLLTILITFLNTQKAGSEAPGSAPEGKVWSDEHGHWHDAP